MGEFELIERFFRRAYRPADRLQQAGGAGKAPQEARGPGASAPDAAVRTVLGIGDDCALLAMPMPQPAAGSVLAVSTDMLVAGRHFFADVDPESLGHKTLAVNLSDLAAMGAEPRAFTLALALPHVDAAWLDAFARGLFALADAHGAELVGGDTTGGPLTLCVTVFGEVPPAQALRRDRARDGDDLWVSGALGAAAWAVRRRLAGAPLPAGHPALDRLQRPVPRVALGRALRGVAHAAIDLSDGLAGDLRHVLDRSGVGAELDVAALPVHACLDAAPAADRLACALCGGDDYELAFTAPRAARDAVARAGCEAGVPVTRVGAITRTPGLRLAAEAALLAQLPATLQAFDHFRSAPGAA